MWQNIPYLLNIPSAILDYDELLQHISIEVEKRIESNSEELRPVAGANHHSDIAVG